MESAHGFPAILRGYRLALTVQGLRPSTVEAYHRDARRFGTFVANRPLGSVTPADLRE